MDKVALVTGADRGLGSAMTADLLRMGWTVLAGRHMDWPELDDLSEKFPDRLRIVPLDVGSDRSSKQAARLAATVTDHVDLLISNAAINRSHQVTSIREPQNFDDMLDEISVNAVGALRVVEAFITLLDLGEFKRLCFVSSEAGSIGASTRSGWFGYCMSKAALNMAVKNLSNDLSPRGFSFRLYHPGWLRTFMSGEKNLEADMEPEEAAAIALRYFLDPVNPSDLTLRGWDGGDLPW